MVRRHGIRSGAGKPVTELRHSLPARTEAVAFQPAFPKHAGLLPLSQDRRVGYFPRMSAVPIAVRRYRISCLCR
jgi:hypothetical protein